MKRRPRSSFTGLSRGAASRAPFLALALALGAAACSSDLFHDTKWQSRCDVEPDAAICPQGTGGSDAGETTTGAGGGMTTGAASGPGAGGAGATTGSTTGTVMNMTTAASTSTG